MKQSNGHIIVIGGGGFIGQGLLDSLSRSNHSVTIIGRTKPVMLRPNESFYSILTQNYKDLSVILAGQNVDAIIDLAYATVPNSSYVDPVADFSENLGNVIAHLDFARSLNGVKYIYISSGGTVYGDAGAPRPFSETDPNFPLSPYGITKMACERYVQMYHRLHGLETLIIRPSNIYGPGQKPFRGQGLVATALGLALKQQQVQIFGTGSHIRDYLYIDDFCRGLTSLMKLSDPGGIYNLGYGKGHSILEIIDRIAETVADDGLGLHRRAEPERPFDVHYNVLNIDKISAATGWQPEVSLSAGIGKTWAWIKEYMTQQ